MAYHTHRIHGTSIYTYIYHKYQSNVGTVNIPVPWILWDIDIMVKLSGDAPFLAQGVSDGEDRGGEAAEEFEEMSAALRHHRWAFGDEERWKKGSSVVTK